MRNAVGSRGVQDGYRVDSAGTGAWHEGEPPDPRSAEVARGNGVDLKGRARRVTPSDFHDFDWIVAMDRENLRNLEALQHRSGGDAGLVLLRDFDPEPGDREVPDPYYGGADGFDQVYTMIDRSIQSFLDHLEVETDG